MEIRFPPSFYNGVSIEYYHLSRKFGDMLMLLGRS